MKEDNIYNEEDAMMESEEMCATRFDDIFDMALIASHRMCIAKNKVINRERYAILERVCDGMPQVFHTKKKAEISLHSSFASGGVGLRVPEVSLNRADLDRLKDLLHGCSTISFSAVTTEEVELGVTVNRVYKDE